LNKLISYSLYGNDSKYLKGAIQNSLLAKKFFPDWTTRFYCGVDVPSEILRNLEGLGSQVYAQKNDWHPNGMFWRYYASADYDYDRIVFRDVDSRFSNRDVISINQWEESGRSFHIVRDHPFHMTQILGGLFGITKSPKLVGLPWEKSKDFGTALGQDQRFLTKWIYPLLDLSDTLIHDNFFWFEGERFRLDYDKDFVYMGESFDENENYDSQLRNVLALHAKSRLFQEKLHLKSFLVRKFKS
jgi:hypothetical protein